MGVTISHNCYRGSCTSFNTFRKNLCRVAGYGNLYDYYEEKKSFKQIEHDSLIILLNHSDCDGTIAWKDCHVLANRLKQLLPLLKKEKDYLLYENDEFYFKFTVYGQTQQFILGLLKAHEAKENIEFI